MKFKTRQPLLAITLALAFSLAACTDKANNASVNNKSDATGEAGTNAADGNVGTRSDAATAQTNAAGMGTAGRTDSANGATSGVHAAGSPAPVVSVTPQPMSTSAP